MHSQPLNTIELNIALVPTKKHNSLLVHASHEIAQRFPVIVQLSGDASLRLAMASHLTLLHGAMLINDLPSFGKDLEPLAGRPPIALQANGCVYNAGERSIEAGQKATPELVALQHAVITRFNAYRGDLLVDRDPAGHPVRPLLTDQTELGENIRRYGYAEVNGLFRPHDTVNWLNRTAAIDTAALQAFLASLPPLPGTYDAVAIYALGPNGSCPQRLACYPFTGTQ